MTVNARFARPTIISRHLNSDSAFTSAALFEIYFIIHRHWQIDRQVFFYLKVQLEIDLILDFIIFGGIFYPMSIHCSSTFTGKYISTKQSGRQTAKHKLHLGTILPSLHPSHPVVEDLAPDSAVDNADTGSMTKI